MSEGKIQVYGYRWIILLLFMLVNISLQILWISYAAVTIEAATYYGVTDFEILLLSLVFMIAYIPVTFLAIWLINKFGFRIGASIGALLGGVFGLLRFFAGTNYMLILIFTIMIAIGQPFILNSVTLLSANWFPESERTTATGLSMISQFLGIALGLFITPFLVEIGFDAMLLTYGIFSLAIGIIFTIFAKNKPPTPPTAEQKDEKLVITMGLKQLFTNKLFWILFIVFFIGLGAFNMVTTYIELIVVPRGLTAIEAGILGGIMLLGGIAGSIVMSALSDKLHKKKILIIISIVIAFVAFLVMSFAFDAILLYIFGFLLGYGLLSAGPVALELAVDVTHPVPEASSNGMLMMIGQVGGIVFILAFEDFTIGGDYFPALIVLTVLIFVLLILAIFLKDVKRE